MIRPVEKSEEGEVCLHDALAEALERLDSITLRVERRGDHLSAWTIREVARQLTGLAGTLPAVGE